MDHQPHQREKKALSMKGLLQISQEVFAKVPRSVKRQKISLTDCFMSALENAPNLVEITN